MGCIFCNPIISSTIQGPQSGIEESKIVEKPAIYETIHEEYEVITKSSEREIDTDLRVKGKLEEEEKKTVIEAESQSTEIIKEESEAVEEEKKKGEEKTKKKEEKEGKKSNRRREYY